MLIYRCESGFSAYAYTKNKYRSRPDAAPDMCIQLSDIKPDFKAVIHEKIWSSYMLHIKLASRACNVQFSVFV